MSTYWDWEKGCWMKTVEPPTGTVLSNELGLVVLRVGRLEGRQRMQREAGARRDLGQVLNNLYDKIGLP